MRISELFYSIQGEGMLVGVPSVFVRTSGCNLRCAWCDTPYASWKPEGRECTVAEIVAEVQSHPARHVVLTGGEPMIAKDLPELAQRLRAAGYHLTIETAGTIAPEGIACDLASISPKLAHSTPSVEQAGQAWVRRHEETRLQPDVLRAWAAQYEVQWKFVIASESDLSEARQVIESVGLPIEPAQVLLMPEGIDRETLHARYPLLIEACKHFGYRLSPRFHVDLFGNKRGT
jgi:7-carboxy-7-deazaguanine synthase